MRRHTVSSLASILAILVAACSSSDDSTPQPGGTTPPPSGATVALTPAQGNILTCTGTVTATVTGASRTDVTWSTDPAGIGAADASGAWAAPNKTPAPASFTLTATSTADAMAKASGGFTLATAVPGAPVTVATTDEESYGVFPHWVATRGTRAYAVWPAPQGPDAKLMISRSDDGGKTWGAPKTALSGSFDGGDHRILCAAVAIDAANPDVVYVTAQVPNSKSFAVSVGSDSNRPALVLGVSSDGGATFTPRVLQVGGAAGGPHLPPGTNYAWDGISACGDVSSPAADTVVVEDPGGYNGDGNPDMAVWTDTARGAGFANGTLDDSKNYVAAGWSLGLADVLAGVTTADQDKRLGIGQNGGSDDAGGATEAPRLFTDGKGRLCVTYVGTIDDGHGSSWSNAYVQCSTDAGKTFSTLLNLDSDVSKDTHHSQPVGALDGTGRAAVVWTTGVADGGKLFIATSTDNGATFGAPAPIPTYVLPGATAGATASNPSIAYDAAGILWLAYVPTDGGFSNRIIVDKSCDGGATWSGPVLVNGKEATGEAGTDTIVNMRWPAFVTAPGAAPLLFAHASDHLAVFPLSP